MPCYLFTYHSYGSWLPDKKKGYVVRKQGVQPTNVALVATYRRRMSDSEVRFTEAQQATIIEALLKAAQFIHCRTHFIAAEPTHIHLLTSWGDDQTRQHRQWQQKRNSCKRAITIAMKQQYGQRVWLSDSSSRRRVKDRRHFEYLINHYLPRHRGWNWAAGKGLHKHGC